MSFAPIKLYRRPKNIDDPAPEKPKPKPNPDPSDPEDTGSSDNPGYTPSPDDSSDDTSSNETYPYFSWYSSNFESPFMYDYLGDITPLGWPSFTYDPVYKDGNHFLHWKNTYELYADRVFSNYPRFRYKLDGEEYEQIWDPGDHKETVGGMTANCDMYKCSEFWFNNPKFTKELQATRDPNYEYNVEDHTISDIQLVYDSPMTCQYKDGSKTFEVVPIIHKRWLEPENVFPTTVFKTYDDYAAWFSDAGTCAYSAYLSKQQYDRFISGKPIKNVFIDVFYPEKNPDSTKEVPRPDTIRTSYDVEGSIEMSYEKDGNTVSEIVKVQDAIDDPTGDHSSFAFGGGLNNTSVTFKVVDPIKLHIDGKTVNLDAVISTNRAYLDMKEGDYTEAYTLPATVHQGPSHYYGPTGDSFRIMCAERSTIEKIKKIGFVLV